MKNVFVKLLVVLSLFLHATLSFAIDRITYIHTDASGTPIAGSDEDGNLAWRAEYYPFGDQLEITSDHRESTLGFTGKSQEQDIGLSYFGARFYDPVVGRFTSMDPAPIEVENHYSINRYAYANNNPYKYVDPDGRFAFPLIIAAAAFTADVFITTSLPYQNGEAQSISFPDLGVSSAIKSGVGISAIIGTKSVAKGAGKTIHIGKVDDLKNVPRNQTILDELPDLGSPKANWKQNSSVLRKKIREGYDIKDVSKHRPNSSPDPTPLRPGRTVGQSFLGAERNLLENKGIKAQ